MSTTHHPDHDPVAEAEMALTRARLAVVHATDQFDAACRHRNLTGVEAKRLADADAGLAQAVTRFNAVKAGAR